MHKQRGVTFIGWLVLLLPIAVIGYAAIRLTPVYLNYMKVARTLEEVRTSVRVDGSLTPDKIKRAIENRLDIESVDFPSVNDISVTRNGAGWTVRANYEETTPLFANISMLAVFDKSVELQ